MSTSTKIALIIGLGAAAYFVFKRGASLSSNVGGENLNVSLGRSNRHRNLINEIQKHLKNKIDLNQKTVSVLLYSEYKY